MDKRIGTAACELLAHDNLIRNEKVQEEVLSSMDVDLQAIAAHTDSASGVTAKLNEIWNSPPVAFDATGMDAIRHAAQELQVPAKEMVSGAGHDAVYVARMAPTSMIFIPCQDGLSHNEAESVKQEDATNGANALLLAVLTVAQKPG